VATSDSREIEAALIVQASNPPDVFARVRVLDSLAGYELRRESVLHLRDLYLDTPTGELRTRALAVRSRHVDGSRLLTFKADLGDRERMEVEGADSSDTRRRIQAEMRRRGVRLDFSDLVPTQERETTREVVGVTGPSGRIAELALDSVTYHVGPRTVRVFEVEIELSDSRIDLQPFVEGLRRAVPELREWPHSKLVTGFAIAEALSLGELSLSSNGLLAPADIDVLAAKLAGDRAGATSAP